MRVEREIVIESRRKAVWDVIATLHEHPQVLAGVTAWKPVEDKPLDVGSRIEARMRVGSAQLNSLVEITEFTDGCDIAWTSLTGVDHRGRFTLRDGGDADHMVLRFRMTYTPPGGFFGMLAGQAARAIMQSNVDATVRAMKQWAEGTQGEIITTDPVRRLRWLGDSVDRVADAIDTGRVLRRAGLLEPSAVVALAGGVDALRRWGFTFGTATALAASRDAGRPAVFDEVGELSYGDLDRRTNAYANGLAAVGIEPGDRVGLMCRNHRGFVEALIGLAKLGADALLLNTSFSGPQLQEVLEREKAVAIVFDAEFTEAVGDALPQNRRFVAWDDDGPFEGPGSVESLLAAKETPPPAPGRMAKQVILTSGTTGTPKGAERGTDGGVAPIVAILSRVPLRAGETSVVAPPLFHAWGFAHMGLALLLGSTIVLRRKFDPAATLAAIARSKATALVVVPVMLQRIMQLPEAVRRAHDTSSLQIIAASGSALPGDLATSVMDEFGDVLYNLYGSTEVAWATIAGPEDLRLVPGTAGRPPRGTVVKILDDNGVEVPDGQTGRIFVGSSMAFEGYTGGEDKSRVGGLVSSGDLGRWDWSGRLQVEGRDDDMIVSGGENVFPGEVEDVLARHDAVDDVAVVGVTDEKFGQALEAWVVLSSGGTATADELRGYVKQKLANYKTPRRVNIVDELPRNSTGKVLKRELKEEAEKPKE